MLEWAYPPLNREFLLKKLRPACIAVMPFSTSQQCCCRFMFAISVQQNEYKLYNQL